MNIHERAKRLFELLQEDSKGCFDVDLYIDPRCTRVCYEDQVGRIWIDFENLHIVYRTCMEDMGGPEESIDQFKNETTIDLHYYFEDEYKLHYIETTDEYDSLSDLWNDLSGRFTMFDYLEGAKECFEE